MYNFLYSSNRAGVPLLELSIYSVCKHIGYDKSQFYILHADLKELECNNIKKDLGPECNLHFININPKIFENFRNAEGLPPETFFRMYGVELLPDDVHHILYLDIDVLCVSNDMKYLFDKNWDDTLTIAAVPDGGIKGAYERRLFRGCNILPYFNAGVLYVNVDFIKSYGLWDKAKALLKKDNDYVVPDQDVFNILMKDNYLPLSHRFNYMSPQIFKDMMFYRRKNMEKGSAPVLIHFDGPHKPWYLVCANPYKRIYQEYQKELGVTINKKLNRSIKYKFKIMLQYVKFQLSSL